jgi:S-phase kinase-associated protein 1
MAEYEVPPTALDGVDWKTFIVLTTRDGKSFKMSRAAAMTCKMLANMIGDADDDAQIKLDVDSDSEAVPLVIKYSEYHKDTKAADLPMPLLKHIDEYLGEWDKAFVYSHLVDKDNEANHKGLLDVMTAAHYFDNEELLNLTCAKVGSMIQDKTPEQIRELLGLPDDFTPEQRERNAHELQALANL